jgi:hypothetical protein
MKFRKHSLLLSLTVIFICQIAEALILQPTDHIQFLKVDGSVSDFEPTKTVRLDVRRDNATILTEDFTDLQIGPMNSLANTSAVIRAALQSGLSVNIGNGKRDDLENARKRIIASFQSQPSSSFTKAYIDNLNGAIYTLQNSLEFKAAVASRCEKSTPRGNGPEKTGR